MWNPGILQYVCFFKEFLTYKIENCFCEYKMTTTYVIIKELGN